MIVGSALVSDTGILHDDTNNTACGVLAYQRVAGQVRRVSRVFQASRQE